MCNDCKQYNIDPEFETILHETNEYEASALPTALRKKKSYTKWIQSSLNKILRLNLKIDGMMDSKTRSAIRSFQKKNGLPANGMIGPETESLLIQSKRQMHLPPDKEYEGEVIEGVGLGLAILQFGQSLATSGRFEVNSSYVSYIHENTPLSQIFRNAELDFRIFAHHPRYFIDTQNLWFKLRYEYNGNDIRNAGIVGLVNRSSNLYSSTFKINFVGDKNSVPQNPITEIVFNISGEWDPVGTGDVSFWGKLIVKADGSMPRMYVFSEDDWVYEDKFYPISTPVYTAPYSVPRPTPPAQPIVTPGTITPTPAVTLRKG
jgi:peptidoglycan hydrolase-like protein with peptidoglycan-binding domain